MVDREEPSKAHLIKVFPLFFLLICHMSFELFNQPEEIKEKGESFSIPKQVRAYVCI